MWNKTPEELVEQEDSLVPVTRVSLMLPWNLTNTSTLDHYLFTSLGPKQRELYKVIPVTVVYCIILVTGIVGNISTCIVIARNKYMQTATNYYLFNLAIADLLVLVLGLPLETYSFWQAYPWIFGQAFCVIRTMAAETSTYASILTITAFTVERYVAICHPMRAHSMSSLRRAVKVIILIWIVSAVCSIPMVIQFGVVYLTDANGIDIPQSATCNVDRRRYVAHVFELATFLFFLTPMTIITVLYALIGLAIKRSTLSRSGSDKSMHNGQMGRDVRHQQQTQARLAVLKMLVAVVVAFFICWAPFHLQRLMVIYIKKSDSTEAINLFQNLLFYVSGILYYVSSTINPILYNIMSLKFRQAFKNTIFRPCRRKKRRRLHTTYKFSKKQCVDTNMILIQGQHLLKCKRVGQGDKPVAAAEMTRSNSSSASGATDPHPAANAGERIELETVVEVRSCHTPNDVPTHSPRPYHSCS